jgi:predicted permease
MNQGHRAIQASFRIWRTNPGLVVTATAALALGIGFTTTMFGIVHGATRPLPLPQAHEIVAIEKRFVRAGADGATRPLDVQGWGAARSFEAIGGYESIGRSLGGEEPEQLHGVQATANLLALAGRGAAIGRVLEPEDGRLGAAPVVVLSHALWTRRFGGDAAIVGGTIRLGGTPHVVIGVMPPRFGFPINAEFWIPLTMDGVDWRPGVGPRLQAVARLAEGVSPAAAAAELDVLSREAAAPALRIAVVPFTEIETPREIIRGLYLLVLASSFVLLIACSNVATLLLARAAVRARDVAVRLALGATRRQLVVEQIAEVIPVAMLAAAAGLGIAAAGTRLFAVNTAHIIEAFWVDIRVDPVVALVAALLATLATLASGLGPAFRASRGVVADVLRDRAYSSGLSVGRMSRALIGVQVALACALLAFTILLAQSAVGLRAVPWPADPSSILTFEFELPDEVSEDEARRPAGLQRVLDAVAGAPGVEDAGLVTALPGRGSGSWRVAFDRPATDEDSLLTNVSFVSAGFFDVLTARPLAGRLLAATDTAHAPRVVVVNESFVRRFSPERNPVGRRLYIGPRDFEIVGIVGDLLAGDVQDRRQDGLYAPIFQTRPFGVRVMARGSAPPLSLLPGIRGAIRTVDRDMPLTEIFTLHEAVYRDKRVLEALSALFLVFGLGALGLTAIGLYGVVSFAVTARTRELGIRRALGATSGQIAGLIARHGSRQLAAGLLVGLLLAVGLSRAFAAAVEALPPADGPVLAGIAVALAITVAVAMALPTRRAVRLEVVRALRE